MANLNILTRPFKAEYKSRVNSILDSNANITSDNLNQSSIIVNPLKSIKFKKKYNFEHNLSIRRRQHTRLIRKLCLQIEEYNMRIGQQAVFATCSNDPTSFFKSFRVFGSQPLENIVKLRRTQICKRLCEISKSDSLLINKDEAFRFNLPSIQLNGEPCPLNFMTQTHLRCFIPEMLKASTGRSKPGWGKDEYRPLWWPNEIPWENVRTDARDEEQKKLLPWTQCLKRIVRCCYTHHNRVDLLLDEKATDNKFIISVNLANENEFINCASSLHTDGKKSLDPAACSDQSEIDEIVMCVQTNEQLQQLLKDGYLKVNPIIF